MDKTRQLVIVGDSAFAEVAHEYFDAESDYRVAGFAVERAFLKRDTFHGLPVVAFEDLERHFPPQTHAVYVATVYTQLNRLRARLAAEAKARGYALASFVSPRAQVWRTILQLTQFSGGCRFAFNRWPARNRVKERRAQTVDVAAEILGLVV
jgi:hypothetical protein